MSDPKKPPDAPVRRKRSGKELTKRYILFVISLFVTALGVALTRRAGLGVPPNSSISNVLSLHFLSIEIGTFIMLYNFVLLALQIILLRKRFDPIQLIQIPVSFAFGYFTNWCVMLVSPVPVPGYPVQMVLTIAGIIVLALGISMGVIADVVLNSAEGLVKALSDLSGISFGTIKIIFDIVQVCIAVILSLILFDMRIVGVREGTIIAAILTGLIVKFFMKTIKRPVEGLLEK
ncbi:MAG: YitT family protein [Lachnospiraceae bacterium]|nr:YitT family protein [Lachnospiraceae bacterium]